ncbi:hypothetical protein PG984_005316 [Apiospora sp. TS-2023a]
MSSDSAAPGRECDVTIDLSEPASGAVFDYSYLSDGFEALLRFNMENEADADGSYPQQESINAVVNRSVTPNDDHALVWTLFRPMQSAGLPSGIQPQQKSDFTSEQPIHEPMDCTMDDRKFELDDFYNTPGLEWDSELLEVPTEEADNEVPSEGLAACASGPQCFNCGSSLEWDEATGLLVDCETCFCPN